MYNDQLEIIRDLSNEEAGRLMRAVFEYSATGKEPDFNGLEMAAFRAFRITIDRDMQKYSETSRKRAAAGRKGGKQTQAKQANASNCQQKSSKSSDSDSDSDSDSESDSEKYIHSALDDSDSLRAENHQSKQEAHKRRSEFLSAFNEATGRNFRVIDSKTERQLKARLREGFTIDEIITAARNCMTDDYHKENPKYLTPEFITRADKLQKYLEYTKKQKGPTQWL